MEPHRRHRLTLAGAMGIAKAYGSCDELFADPDIEAIYNPLPNDQHVVMTLAAARAGKHVLRVVALFDRDPDPDFQTDRTVTAIVDFGGGRRLDFKVSTQSVPYQRVNTA
jgi:hypothetical protein